MVSKTYEWFYKETRSVGEACKILFGRFEGSVESLDRHRRSWVPDHSEKHEHF